MARTWGALKSAGQLPTWPGVMTDQSSTSRQAQRSIESDSARKGAYSRKVPQGLCAQKLQHGARIAHFELTRRLDVDRFYHAVFGQQRESLRAHAHAARC